MMETSSMLNLRKNMSDPYTNSNSPPLSMTNLLVLISSKAPHSKSYRNPKKSNISTSDSSLTNHHLHSNNKRSKHLSNLQLQGCFRYTLLNS